MSRPDPVADLRAQMKLENDAIFTRLDAIETDLDELAIRQQGSVRLVPERVIVGDMVHYFIVDRFKQCRGMGVGPYAAMVLRVDGGDDIDLCVYAPNQTAALRVNVARGTPKKLALAGTEEELDQWWTPRPAPPQPKDNGE